MLKRGNDIDRQLQEILKAKEMDRKIQEALTRKAQDEIGINAVKDAAQKIREDLKDAAKKQEQEHDRDMELQAKLKEGAPDDKSVELIKEIEDILDIDEIKTRMTSIESCAPLQKSWTKETLILNLK